VSECRRGPQPAGSRQSKGQCHDRGSPLLGDPAIRYSEHLDGDGATIFAHACKRGLEGIVSKRRKSPYRSGQSKTWLKVKNPQAPGVLRFKVDEP
jgi:hypothetical protein